MDAEHSHVDSAMPGAGDIAIVGFSFKLPQGVDDDDGFWDMLQNQRNMKTGWPESRINIDSFLNNKHHKFQGRGAHFIKDDVTVFDAPFFSVTAKEAASMDPMQRWTLEASYHAFENGKNGGRLRRTCLRMLTMELQREFLLRALEARVLRSSPPLWRRTIPEWCPWIPTMRNVPPSPAVLLLPSYQIVSAGTSICMDLAFMLTQHARVPWLLLTWHIRPSSVAMPHA